MSVQSWETIGMERLCRLAMEAGRAVMAIYEEDFDVEYKEDRSPLTEADRVAHRMLCEGLEAIAPLPILSEEGKEIPYERRKEWTAYWCIDPIDGTKEFVGKNGEFTLNIALIHRGEPVLGVVLAPALGLLYRAKRGEGSYRMHVDIGDETSADFAAGAGERLPLRKRRFTEEEAPLRIVASKSHLDERTRAFIEKLRSEYGKCTLLSKGSSLKLLMVAEGSAEIYPRLAPTMEWDTAAADAIVREAGGRVCRYDDSFDLSDPASCTPLRYNKADLLNPPFIVRSAGS